MLDKKTENSEAYYNSTQSEHGISSTGYHASGMTSARNGTHQNTFRGNKVWNNWGEGLSTFESTYSKTMLSGTTCPSTCIYPTPKTLWFSAISSIPVPGNGVGNPTGIDLSDEPIALEPVISRDNTIINNFVMGGWLPLSAGGSLVNDVIANNTFINGSEAAVKLWGSGVYTNLRYVNNIAVEDSSSLPWPFGQAPA